MPSFTITKRFMNEKNVQRLTALIIIAAFLSIQSVSSINPDILMINKENVGIDNPQGSTGVRTDHGITEINSHLFFTHLEFRDISSNGKGLWAITDDLLFHLHDSANLMKVYEVELNDEHDELLQLHAGMNTLFILTLDTFYIYDYKDGSFDELVLPGGLESENVVTFHGSTWTDEEGGYHQSFFLMTSGDSESKLLCYDISDRDKVIKKYEEKIPQGSSDYIWSDFLLDIGLAVFNEKQYLIDHDGVRDVSGLENSLAGGLSHYSKSSDVGKYHLSVLFKEGVGKMELSESDVVGQEPQLSGPGVDLIWESGSGKGEVVMDVQGHEFLLIYDDTMVYYDGTRTNTIPDMGAGELILTEEMGFILENGDLLSLSFDNLNLDLLKFDMPGKDPLTIVSLGDGIVTSDEVSISWLKNLEGDYSSWVIYEEIEGEPVSQAVMRKSNDGRLLLFLNGKVFQGRENGDSLEWESILETSMENLISMAINGNDLALQNSAVISIIDTGTGTSVFNFTSDIQIGNFLKMIEDPIENSFWFLSGNGFGSITPFNGSYAAEFFSKDLVEGDEMRDIGLNNKAVWVLTEDGVGAHYRITGERENKTFDFWQKNSHPKRMLVLNDELFVVGEEVVRIGLLAAESEFEILNFGNGLRNRITDISLSSSFSDGSKVINILEGDNIRWFNTTKSLWRSLSTSNGLASNDVRQVTEDPYSNDVWVAAYGGVTKYDKINSSFQVLTSDDGLSNNFVYTAYADEHGIWLGTDGGGVCILDRDGGWTTLSKDDGLAETDVLMIKPAYEEKYWFCTDGGLSLYDREEGTFDNFKYPGDIAGEWVWDIDYHDGKVYVASDKGISIMDNKTGDWTRFYRPLDMPAHEVFSIDIFRYDSFLYMWAGTSSGAVCFNMDNDDWKVINQEDGLEDINVKEVFFDGEKVWVGTGYGIYLFSPSGEMQGDYRRGDGLVHNKVEGISKYGSIVYIATSGGVSIFNEMGTSNSISEAYMARNQGQVDIELLSYSMNLVNPEGMGKNIPGTNSAYEMIVNISFMSDFQLPFDIIVSNRGFSPPIESRKDYYLSNMEALGSDETDTDNMMLVMTDNFAIVRIYPNSGLNSMNDTIKLKVADGDDLYIFCDAHDSIPEIDESNNMIVASVDIPVENEKEFDEAENDGNPLFIALAFGSFLLGIILALLIRRRNRKNK